MTIADLVQTLHDVPSQVFVDLLLGLPLVFFAVLVLLAVAERRRRW